MFINLPSTSSKIPATIFYAMTHISFKGTKKSTYLKQKKMYKNIYYLYLVSL